MNVMLWLAAAALCVLFLAPGVMKLTQPKRKLFALGWEWTESFGAGQIKMIGVLELLAAVGVILPAVVGIAPGLVPLAALGAVLLMIGATITHARRREIGPALLTVVVLILAAIVAWGRFGPYALP